MRKSLRVLRYVAVFFIALAIACLGVMWLSDPFPVRSLAQPSGGLEKAWWLQPQPLSPSEVSAQQWLADTTCRLPPEREKEVWDVGGSQHGNFSIRYQAAFAGYAAAALGMRTPAYVGLTRRVISNTVARVADRKAWSYIQSYWSREAWFPDPCACGNVMYTGHLMMLMALEEALSGDTRYNRDGVELVWDSERHFRYTTRQLAEVTAAQIRTGAGGVTCEPNLVFFACNNHPHITFRLLEGMGYGNWKAESGKWEKWALSRLRATAGGGAFRLLHHVRSGLSVPRGMPGFDGWCLLWYVPWASDPVAPSRLWALACKKINWREFGAAPHEEPESVVVSDCCNPVKVPSSATASFLAAAARACGDAVTAERLEKWLDACFRREADGRFWLDTPREWRTGVTANRFLALAQANGSDLRALVRRPLPRHYFDGPLLEFVSPDDTPVYQAYRSAENSLMLEIDGHGKTVTLGLRNVGPSPAVCLPEGGEGAWNAKDGTLTLVSCGRAKIEIHMR